MSQLLNQLLNDESKTLVSESVESEITLDEEVAMNKMAAALNVFDSEENSEKILEQVSIVRLNRAAKTSSLASRQALLMAKAKLDPLYEKYAKFNGIRLSLREMIYKKYGSRALQRARKLISATSSSKNDVAK